MIDETLDGFPTIPKSKQQHLKMLAGDIKSSRYHVYSIFTRLDDAQDREDMLFILKQLAAEELLSPEQFEQLYELELEEPLRRNGISHERYTNIKEDNNILQTKLYILLLRKYIVKRKCIFSLLPAHVKIKKEPRV